MKLLQAADVNLLGCGLTPLFLLIFPSHFRNTLQIFWFLSDSSVCLPKVCRRLPDIWKLSAPCWASELLMEGFWSEMWQHQSCTYNSVQISSLTWLKEGILGESGLLEIPGMGQVILWSAATTYTHPSTLPKLSGTLPHARYKLQILDTLAAPDNCPHGRGNSHHPPSACLLSTREGKKSNGKRQISDITGAQGHTEDSEGNFVKEAGNFHPLPPHDGISANTTDGLTIIWNSFWKYSVLEY